jgi:predicted AAA+ superfamily ATPase
VAAAVVDPAISCSDAKSGVYSAIPEGNRSMFQRLVSFPVDRSFFLLGARGSGKTTLLRQRFAESTTLFLDLLSPSTELRFHRKPELLEGVVSEAAGKVIVLDEIQKVPALLDVVHSLLSRGRGTFVLTGSSSRKLRRGGANLLAGRAAVRELYPLSYLELGDSFSLDRTLAWGNLPEVQTLPKDADRLDFLLAYAQTYLREEIAAEQLVRKVDAFRGFLEVAAQGNTRLVNATNIARDTGLDPKTVQSYFSILEDTHLGFFLEQYHLSARKRVLSMPKFFFFDNGVARALAQTIHVPIAESTSYYGECFEHFLVAELWRLAAYENRGRRIQTLRTQDDFEVDLVMTQPGQAVKLVEIKSATAVDERHAKALLLAAKDFPADSERYVISRDGIAREEDGIRYMPWQEFLKKQFAPLLAGTTEQPGGPSGRA